MLLSEISSFIIYFHLKSRLYYSIFASFLLNVWQIYKSLKHE
ncbi:hypothetical protein HMPREF2141_03482 [Bacteroides uniformis]|nr:hypothetical protein HMPREF2141_03482 [Bacteroides uniformis]